MKKKLIDKIHDRTAKIGIIGLGYVGLPLAVEYAEGGFTVVGFDIAKDKVRMISKGKSYIDDISDTRLKPITADGRLTATTDDKLLKKMDCVSICVPTPLSKTKDPDISFILAAVDWLKKHLYPHIHILLLLLLDSFDNMIYYLDDMYHILKLFYQNI